MPLIFRDLGCQTLCKNFFLGVGTSCGTNGSNCDYESVLLINKGASPLIEKPHYFRGPKCQKEISIVSNPIGIKQNQYRSN